MIIVDNIPQMGPDLLEKLQNVIYMIFSKFGEIRNDYYPEGDEKTKEYIFLEYASSAHAMDAVNNANEYNLDKQHEFQVNLFTDFDKYMKSVMSGTFQRNNLQRHGKFELLAGRGKV